MRIRKFMMTTFLCGGLAALPGYALAQLADDSGALLQPNSPWTVSEIAASSPGGKPYCALARRFSNNMVLTMARNANEETSLAIDFQKNVLSGGQTYHVALSPGFGQDRAFDVVPVSGNAAVVRLGQDYSFTDALARSGRLQVEIAGSVYNFNISDISSGQTQLGTCLSRAGQSAGAQTAAPRAAAPLRTASAQDMGAQAQGFNAMAPAAGPAYTGILSSPVTVAPLPALRVAAGAGGAQQQSLDLQLQSLQEENMRLRDALEKQRRDYEDRFLKESRDGSVANELSEKVQLLQAENNRLHDQVAHLGASADAAAASQAMADLAKARSENTDLRRQLDDVAKKGDAAQSAKADLARLQAENDRLNSQIASLTKSSQASDSAKAQIEQLKSQNDRLSQQLAEAGAKGGADASARAQLLKMQQDNDKLRRDLQAQMQQSGGVNANMQAELAGLRAENDRLKQALSSGQGAESDTLASMRKELATLQVENTGLKQKVAALSNGAGAASNPADTGKINALQAENDRLHQTMQAQQQQFTQLEQQLSAAKNADKADGDKSPEAVLQQRVMQLQAENAGLKEQVAQVQSKVPDDGQITLSQLRSIEAQLEAVEQDRDRLISQIDQMHKGKGDELLSISSKNWDLEQATRRYNEAQREIDRLGRQLEEQKQQCSKDKKALEYMLFDPSIASKEQIARVEKLESQIRKSEEALNTIKSEYDGKMEALQKEVAMKTDLAVEAQTKMAALENSAQVAQIAPAAGGPDEVQFRMVEMERDDLARKVDSLKRQLDIALSSPVTSGGALPEKERLMNQIASLQSQVDRLSGGRPADGGYQAAANYAGQGYGGYGYGGDSSYGAYAAAAPAPAGPDGAADSMTPDYGSPAYAGYDSAALAVSAAGISPASGTPDVPAVEVSALDEAMPALPTLGAAAASPAGSPADGAPVALSAAAPAGYAAGGITNVSQVGTLLSHANINPTSPVKQLKDGTSFSWEINGLYGSLEQQPMPAPGSFDSMAQAYLAKTKGRCQGDFAAMPGKSEAAGAVRVASYEIACVGAATSAGASIVFFDRDGTFTAVAHEANVDNMDMAMDARDKLVEELTHTQLASN